MGAVSQIRFIEGRFFQVSGATDSNAGQITGLCKQILEKKNLESAHSLTKDSLTVTLLHVKQKLQPKGFLSSIMAPFQRFVEWVRGKKEYSQAACQRAFYHSMLNVVGDEEDPRLGAFFKETGGASFSLEEAPFSSILSLWQDAVHDTDLSTPLSTLVEYQKRIEEIKGSRFSHSVSKLQKKLIEQIKTKIGELGEGKCMYVPSGIIDGSKKKFEPVLCKITKTGDTFQVEYFGISDAGEMPESDVQKFEEKDEQELLRSVADRAVPKPIVVEKKPMAHLQRDSLTSDQMQTAIQQLVYSASTPVEISSVHDSYATVLKNIIRAYMRESLLLPLSETLPQIGEKPEAEKAPVLQLRSKTLTTASGVARAYVKILGIGVDKEGYKEKLLEYRFKAFTRFWNEAVAQNSIQDPVIRSFFAHTAEKLLRRATGDVKETLESVLKKIRELDANIDREVPKGSEILARERPSIPVLLPKGVSLGATPTFRPIESKPSERSDGVDTRYFEIDSAADFKKLVLNPLQSLVEKGSFERAHFHIHSFMSKIDVKRREKEWIPIYEELSAMIQSISYGLGRLVPSAEDLSYLLLSLKAMDVSYHVDPIPEFSVRIDIAPIISLMGNVYIDLGEYSHVIHACIDHFKTPRSIPYSGWVSEDDFDRDLAAYFTLDPEIENLSTDNKWKRCRELMYDINATGAAKKYAPFMAMRRSYLLLQAFMAPTRVFLPANLVDIIRIVTQTAATKEMSFSDTRLLAEGVPALLKAVQQFLRSRRGKIFFNPVEQSKTTGQYAITIEPFGFALYPPSDAMEKLPIGSRRGISHQLLTKDLGVPVDPALDQACFDVGLVDESDPKEPKMRYKWEKDDIVPQKDGDQVPFLDGVDSFRGKTEWEILDGIETIKLLPKDVFDELQLLQTDPKNRAQNTIGFIVRHMGLLNDKAMGPTLLRLFSRNISQYESFISLTEDMKQWCFTEVGKAMEVAYSQGQMQAYLFLFQLCRKMAAEKKAWIGDTFLRQQERLLTIKGEFERDAIEEALLLHDAGFCFDVEKLFLKIMKFVHMPPQKDQMDPVKEAKAREAIEQFFVLNPKNRSFCVYRFPETKESDWEPILGDFLVFQHGNDIVDLRRLEVRKKGELVLEKIPETALSGEDGKKIVSVLTSCGLSVQDVLFTRQRFEMKIQGITVQGEGYEKKEGNIVYRVFVGDDHEVRLFRKRENVLGWDQFLTQPIVDRLKQKDFPLFLLEKDCWVDGNEKKIFVEEKGKILYQIIPTKKSLQIVTENQKSLVLPSRDDFGQFLDIEDPSYIEIILDPLTVRYPRFALTYVDGKIVEGDHAGFALSSQSLHSKDPLMEHFFHPAFGVYHLLEKEGVPPRVLLPKAVYPLSEHKTQSQIFTPVYTTDMVPVYAFELDPVRHILKSDVPEANLYLAYTLLVQGNFADAFFFLDKANIQRPVGEDGKETLSLIRRHLLSLPKSPETVALMARLFIFEEACLFKGTKPESTLGQFRSMEAASILRDIQDFPSDQKISLREETVLEQCKTRGFFAFLDHISATPELYKLWKQIPALAEGVMDDTLQGIDLVQLKRAPDKSKYLKEHSVLASLIIDGVISKEEAAASTIPEIQFLYACIYGQIPEKKPAVENEGLILVSRYEALLNLKKWKEIKEKILDPFDIGLKELESFKQKTAVSDKRPTVQTLLRLAPMRAAHDARRRISAMQKTIEEAQPSSTKTKTQPSSPVALFPQLASFFTKKPEAPAEPAKSPSEPRTYGDKILQEFRADVLAFKRREKVQVERVPSNPGEKTLKDAVNDQIKTSKESALKAKKALLMLFPKKKGISLRRVGRQSDEAFFETALRCYGEGSLAELSRYGIKKEQFSEVVDLCKQYLKSSIQETAATKAKKILDEGKDAEANLVLTNSFQYDPDTDPDAPTFLLLEYELGFVCRASQIKVVRKNMETKSCFTQEMCGGGKTTVIRHLFSRLKANGYFLSGVMTLDALRAEHGLQYMRMTKQAYGEVVFDFRFSQETPTDSLSLLQLHESFLRTTVEKGRIDVSRGDLQSFRNAMHKKYEKLVQLCAMRGVKTRPEEKKSLEEEILKLHDEIDIMEDIRDFMKDHFILLSDELDEDCAVTQEKNVAHGEKVPFLQSQQDAVIEVTRCIMQSTDSTVQAMAGAIKKNEHRKFLESAKAIGILAGEIYEKHKSCLGGVTKESFQKYCTDPASKDADDVYKTIFKDKSPLSDELASLAYIRVFLSEILPPYFSDAAGVPGSGVSGVSYGRSKVDGVSVIPYRASDRPKEGSLHGNELLRLFLTCMDYEQKGLSLPQVIAAYNQAKSEALVEIQQAIAEGRTLEMEATTAVKQFKQKFHYKGDRAFNDLGETEFSSIIQTMNGDSLAILEYLKEQVLPKMFQHRQKIVSDAQDISDMVYEHSGSSGTDTAAETLPDAIDRKEARQEGVHGEVIDAIEKHFGGCVVVEDDICAQVAKCCKGGDCLSDVGQFFPGQPSRYIAEQLLKAFPRSSGVTKIVFIDEADEKKILQKKADGVEILPYTDPKGDEQELRCRFTIFDDPHTRGAERHSMAGVKEFVTVDVDTDWSRFEQGVMRERQLTKGGATVCFLITSRLKEKMGGGDLSFEALQKVLCENEADRLKQLHYTAERQKIKHVIKDVSEKALRAISKESRKRGLKRHHAVREAVYQEMHAQRIFLMETTLSPENAACPQKSKKTDEVLDALIETQKQKMDAIKKVFQSQREVRMPTSMEELHTSIEKLKKNFEEICAAFETVKRTVEDFQQRRTDAVFGGILPDVSAEVRELSAKSIEMEKLKAQETELETLLQKLPIIEQGSRQMGVDVYAQLREKFEEGQQSLLRMQKELGNQISIIKEKCGKVSSEKQSEEKSGGFKLKGFLERAVRKAAVAVLDVGPAKGLIDKTQHDLDSLALALEQTRVTTQNILDFGGSMVSAADPIFEEGERRLLAKESDARGQKGGRVAENMLPQAVVDSALDGSGEEEVETEQEQSQEVSEDVFGADIGVDISKKMYPYKDLQEAGEQFLKTGVPQEKRIYTIAEECTDTPLACIVPPSVAYTENFCPKTASDGKKQFILFDGSLVKKPIRVPSRAVFSCEDCVRVLLPSQLDFAHMKSFEGKSVYNFGTQSFEGKFPEWIRTKEQAEAVAEQIALLKILRGDTDFISIAGEEFAKIAQNTYQGLVRLLKKVPENQRKNFVAQLKTLVRSGSYEGSSLQKAVSSVFGSDI